MTSQRKRVANRKNSLHSTGPRTDEGKAISRQNSLKHGLCANPASSIVEDKGHFERLHGDLVERFSPRIFLKPDSYTGLPFVSGGFSGQR